MDINLRLISFGSEDHQSEIALRFKILREPLGLRFSQDELAAESTDLHIGAFQNDDLVGCLLLRPHGPAMKMRQVAVAQEAQGRGIGKKLVAFSEALAKEKGYDEVILNARETAVPFYLSLGYEIYDEPFIEVTIPHRKMRKTL